MNNTKSAINVKILDEQIRDLIHGANIPHVKVEVNENGETIIDKDKSPEFYDWAVNG